MDREKLKTLTKKYVGADQKFKEVLGEYFVTYWSNESPKTPKVLGKIGIERIEKAEGVLEKTRKTWLKALRQLNQ